MRKPLANAGSLRKRLDLCAAVADFAPANSAAVNNQTNEGVAIKKVTNVFSKKILAKRALREIKLLQHFRGHRNVRVKSPNPRRIANLPHHWDEMWWSKTNRMTLGS